MIFSYAQRCLAILLRLFIHIYRYSFAYFLGGQCRYTPTCSAYALQALEVHGPFKGAAFSLNRLCRCHPWGGHGYDPVPSAKLGTMPRT